ncbi:Meiotic nuclear division protein 1 [Coemansia sp. RSA 552]|nr:Meiotic nuclear division protein 1 [Coemansia sp. RSA 552]
MAKVKKARLRSALLQTQQAKAQRDARQRRIQHQEQQQQQQQGKKPAPSKHKRKPYFPYATHHTILLVGEGNFSFARSVAERLESGANMVATAYDSESVARDKYSDLEDHLSVFRDLGGTVLFGVDGTALDGCSLIRGRRFSHIVFNFPHVGAGIKDQDRNIISNQELLVGFFGSAQAFLDEGVPVESGVLHGSDDEGVLTGTGPRLSLEEKRKRMLEILHEAQEPFLLKELERIGPKQKGIVSQTVKDVVQSLVDDGMCHSEKIGTSNFFWAFPSEAAVKRRTKKAELEKEVGRMQQKQGELKESLKQEQLGREQTEERASLVEELAEIEGRWSAQHEELQKFKECDPVLMNQKRDEARVAQDAANRWTDNIFILQSWLRDKFAMDVAQINKFFDIPDDLDSV